MMAEMEVILEQFKPEDVEKYTGFRPQEKYYRCPLCERAANKRGGNPSFAQIVVDECRNIESLYCFCCCEDLEALKDIEIVENNCQSSDCDSSFIDVRGVCLVDIGMS